MLITFWFSSVFAKDNDVAVLRTQNTYFEGEQDILQQKINDLNSEIESIDKQNEKLQENINDNQEKVNNVQIEIHDNTIILEHCREDLRDEVNKFNSYIRNCYKNSSDTTLDILLTSKDFGDLINRMEVNKIISNYYRGLIDNINANKRVIEQKSNSLLNYKRQLDQVMNYLSDERIKLDNQKQQLKALVDEVTRQQQEIFQNMISSHKVDNRMLACQGRSVSFNETDVMLLAHLIESEAGCESYMGKLAVASVVINRCKFNNASISTIIFDKGQFDGVQTGGFKTQPSVDSINASREVLNGKNVVPIAYYYANLNLCSPGFALSNKFIVRIGNHWFFTV